MTKVTIGADPELFLMREGELKSSIGLIGGSKYEPRPLGDKLGFFVQEDNVAVEFNIPPAETLQAFCDSIAYGKEQLTNEISKYGFSLAIKASAIFPESQLLNPAARNFGCDPDYNAWKNGRRNPRPRAKDSRLRSCGGHIHIGYPEDSNLDKRRLVQLMDLYLGVPSVIMDDDNQRRQLYGRAGAYRDTDYGLEYRTLSNFWLRSSELTAWAYTQTIRAVNRATQFGKPDGNKDHFTTFMGDYSLGTDITKSINKGNVNLAHKLSVHYDLDVR